eukprot:m.31939 g.31939  ORF g.31939 m.31939 type:complete len:271 (+) comp9353_c0_seq1:101-913(+)
MKFPFQGFELTDSQQESSTKTVSNNKNNTGISAPMAGRNVAASLIKDGVIDLSKLEATISSAVQADERYKRENDAKFRAVAQKVQTYEEFEGIVKASHIKPISEDITNLSLGRSTWNSTTRPAASGPAPAGAAGAAPAAAATGVNAPSTGTTTALSERQFQIEWKKAATSEDKYALLSRVGAEGLHQLFPVEVGGCGLGAILQVFDATTTAATSETVAGLMMSLAKASRFSLMLDFLSDQETAATKSLLEKLAASLDADTLASLRATYRV